MIGAAEVEHALRAGAVLAVPPGAVVTASARVRAAQLGVDLTTVNEEQEHRPGTSPVTAADPSFTTDLETVEEATFREMDPNEATANDAVPSTTNGVVSMQWSAVPMHCAAGWPVGMGGIWKTSPALMVSGAPAGLPSGYVSLVPSTLP